MASEVEQRPTLVTASYSQHRHQWVKEGFFGLNYPNPWEILCTSLSIKIPDDFLRGGYGYF